MASWRAVTKIAGSGSGSGSISHGHGSADPDPDPRQNVINPEHFDAVFFLQFLIIKNLDPDPDSLEMLNPYPRCIVRDSYRGLSIQRRHDLLMGRHIKTSYGQCSGSGMFISDPDPHQRNKVFLTQKIVSKLSEIWTRAVDIPDPGTWFFTHPGSRVKKGTGSRNIAYGTGI